MLNKQVLILTGEKQTGKTTALNQWVKKKQQIDGVLTPVINSSRFFYLLPEKKLHRMEAKQGEINTENVGMFKFSASQFEYINTLLIQKLENTNDAFFIIDEVGPLEIKQKKGFWPLLTSLLAQESIAKILVVVRPTILNEAKALFITHNFQVSVIETEELKNL